MGPEAGVLGFPIRLRSRLWTRCSGRPHLCVHIPPYLCPSCSVSSRPQSLTLSLGSCSHWEHCHSPHVFLGTLRLGQKMPQASLWCVRVCAQSGGHGGGGSCSHAAGLPPATATLSPPQPFSLFSGPGAASKCRLDFLRAPGAALCLLSPVGVLPQPPPGSPSAGVGQALGFPLPYKVPLPQAHYNFCRECFVSLSRLCLIL